MNFSRRLLKISRHKLFYLQPEHGAASAAQKQRLALAGAQDRDFQTVTVGAAGGGLPGGRFLGLDGRLVIEPPRLRGIQLKGAAAIGAHVVEAALGLARVHDLRSSALRAANDVLQGSCHIFRILAQRNSGYCRGLVAVESGVEAGSHSCVVSPARDWYCCCSPLPPMLRRKPAQQQPFRIRALRLRPVELTLPPLSRTQSQTPNRRRSPAPLPSRHAISWSAATRSEKPCPLPNGRRCCPAKSWPPLRFIRNSPSSGPRMPCSSLRSFPPAPIALLFTPMPFPRWWTKTRPAPSRSSTHSRRKKRSPPDRPILRLPPSTLPCAACSRASCRKKEKRASNSFGRKPSAWPRRPTIHIPRCWRPYAS